MKKFRAFTLVELLVVVAIVILLSIAAVGGMTYTRQNKSVRATAEAIKNLFDDTRSEAINPTDTTFGVDRYEVRLYPYNSSECTAATPICNEIRVYQVSGANYTLKTTYKLPSGIQLMSNNASSWGNLNCHSNCGSNVDYLFFSVLAQPTASKDIGQLDLTPTNFTMFVSVVGSNEIYQVQMNVNTGSAVICKVSGSDCI